MNRIDRTIKANLTIERRWLESINAPVKRIPKRVADAILSYRTLILVKEKHLEGVFGRNIASIEIENIIKG